MKSKKIDRYVNILKNWQFSAVVLDDSYRYTLPVLSLNAVDKNVVNHWKKRVISGDVMVKNISLVVFFDEDRKVRINSVALAHQLMLRGAELSESQFVYRDIHTRKEVSTNLFPVVKLDGHLNPSQLFDRGEAVFGDIDSTKCSYFLDNTRKGHLILNSRPLLYEWFSDGLAAVVSYEAYPKKVS